MPLGVFWGLGWEGCGWYWPPGVLGPNFCIWMLETHTKRATRSRITVLFI